MVIEHVILPGGKIKRIHVNRQMIDRNRKCNTNQPVLTVKCGGKTYYGSDVIVVGRAHLSQNKKQLSCGARVYIETTDEVEIIP